MLERFSGFSIDGHSEISSFAHERVEFAAFGTLGAETNSRMKAVRIKPDDSYLGDT